MVKIILLKSRQIRFIFSVFLYWKVIHRSRTYQSGWELVIRSFWINFKTNLNLTAQNITYLFLRGDNAWSLLISHRILKKKRKTKKGKRKQLQNQRGKKKWFDSLKWNDIMSMAAEQKKKGKIFLQSFS